MIESESKFILLLSSEQCPACKIAKPIYKDFFKDEPLFVEIDAKQDPTFAKLYGIRSIPTLLFIVDTKEDNRISGIPTKDELIELYEKWKC